MLLNCGVGEDSWESLGLQGDPARSTPDWGTKIPQAIHVVAKNKKNKREIKKQNLQKRNEDLKKKQLEI